MSQGLQLSAVLNELLYGNEVMESVEQTLDRLVTPDFTQRINGQVYRRSEYAAHVREMRRLVAGGGEMRVLEQSTQASRSLVGICSGWCPRTGRTRSANPICSPACATAGSRGGSRRRTTRTI